MMQCTVSLTFADNSQAVRSNSSAILPVEPLKAFISKIKVILIRLSSTVAFQYLIDFVDSSVDAFGAVMLLMKQQEGHLVCER